MDFPPLPDRAKAAVVGWRLNPATAMNTASSRHVRLPAVIQRSASLAALLSLLLGLSACSSIDSSRAMTPLRPAYLDRQMGEAEGRLQHYAGAYQQALDQGDVVQARAQRDHFVAAGTTAIDVAYFEFEKEFKALISAKNATVDSASIMLTTAAVVFDAAGTKTVLAAIDTSLKGINTAVDKHTMREKTLELLNNEMRRQRAQVDSQIRDLITADSDSPTLKFTLEDARRQLVRYFYAGSVTNALTTLAANTADSAGAAEKTLQAATLRSVNASTKSTGAQ
jgi:DNA-binding transcriptional MerR regulator